MKRTSEQYEYNKRLVGVFKMIRKSKGLSQKDTAKICGITQAAYSDYETNKTLMPFAVVWKISKRLGLRNVIQNLMRLK